MPARIVIVHNDPAFIDALANKLGAAGHELAVFEDSMDAFDALRRAERVDILITQVVLRPGEPHGLAIAGAARITRPLLKVIFVASPEVAHYADGEGHVFIIPVNPNQIAQAVEELVSAAQWSADVLGDGGG